MGGSLQALLLAQATRTASTSALLTFPRTSPKLHMLNKTPRFKPTRLIYAIMLGVKGSPLKLKVFRLIDFLSMATICQRYIQAMPKISPRYAQDSSKYAQICSKYAQNMLIICPRYAQYIPAMCPRYIQDMPKYPQDMLKIWSKYAHNIYQKYAQYMPTMCPRYVKISKKYPQDILKICLIYAQNMPKVCPRYA